MTQQEKYKPRWVEDQLSQKHKLTKELGRGGQGVVFQTSDSGLLIKMPLKNGKEIIRVEEVKHFQEQLESLYLLPLSNKMHITRPLYLLKVQAGYVMQMMQDMQPIGEWLPQHFSNLTKEKQKEYKPPAWMSKEVTSDAAYPLDMYAKSGGTKRRLELLTQATIELLRLHSVGVIFMDISPDNIYCSAASEHNEVWMIDADNLRFENVNAQTGVITPQYGAPEIVKGIDGARVISDTYSLALLAFKMLTMSGAFNGRLFIDAQDDEDDWAANDAETEEVSLEVQAEQGELPFICDTEDNSNSQANGLPHELVLTHQLLSFFQKMFGKGRTEFWRRPSLHSLPRLLASAADSSIKCVCGMSFYYQHSTLEQSCPYCSHQYQNLLVVSSYFYTNEGVGEQVWTWVAPFIDGQALYIPRRLSGCFDIDKHNDPMIEINQVEQDWFIYISAEDIRVDVTANMGRFRTLTGQRLLEQQELEEGVQLYLHAPYSIVTEIKVHKKNAI